MNQFFTPENVKKFLAEQKIPDEFDADPVIEAVDCDRIFSRLMEAVMSSPFGSVINMFGGCSGIAASQRSFCKKNSSRNPPLAILTQISRCHPERIEYRELYGRND